MAKRTDHVARTLKIFRERGFYAASIERYIQPTQWNPGGLRIDFCGIADAMAFNGAVTTLIQVCTGADYAKHIRKLLGEVQDDEKPEAAQFRVDAQKCWLANPNRTIEVYGWRKLKNKVKGGGYGKGSTWQPRIKIFSPKDYMGNC